MSTRFSRINLHFWLLIVISISLAGPILGLSWAYGQAWVELIWHVCQAKLHHLLESLPLVWQLIIPAMLLLATIRGGVSVIQQARATLRMIRLFLPLCEQPPARLQALLPAHKLSSEDVVFLNLAPAHAFCLGFWRPRIWLTAGLVNLLTDEELMAVLAHEAYHCRQRDPLRLLIGRALKSAFFFLPLVHDLAKAIEFQQEIAADQSAIAHAGDDLPLLCALQKLLKQQSPSVMLSLAAYNLFNVTEARLCRLIYPPQPVNWRASFSGWLVNLGVLVIIGSLVWLQTQSTAGHHEIGHHCPSEMTTSTQI